MLAEQKSHVGFGGGRFRRVFATWTGYRLGLVTGRSDAIPKLTPMTTPDQWRHTEIPHQKGQNEEGVARNGV
jgi:hypothetical protein